MLLNLLLCGCPLEASVTAIPLVDCLEKFGEIQKIVLQRTMNGAVVNTITINTENPELLATWVALKAAVDNTKVQATPLLHEFENEESEPREASSVGVGGIAEILGDDFSPAMGYFHNTPQKVVKEIRKYNCEFGLSVFLINEHGQIGCIADDNSNATTIKGIPVKSFFVGQKKFGGRNDVDKNKVQWRFLPGFSDNFYVVNPSDFDPLTQL